MHGTDAHLPICKTKQQQQKSAFYLVPRINTDRKQRNKEKASAVQLAHRPLQLIDVP